MHRMIPVLMYHQIGIPAARGTRYRSLTVHPRDFARQMAWMSRLGYQGLSMRDLMPYLRGDALGKVFGITFDDGYRNVFANALPVLNHLGFTSTNYFVVHQLNGSNVWDNEKGVPPSALMSIDEVHKWAAAGQEVGSHSLDHVHLTEVSPEVASQQIVQSKAELEALLDDEVGAFCYPYGSESPHIREMTRIAGYVNATTTVRGLARENDDLFGLPRVTVARSTNIFRFLQKCLTRLEDRRRSG